MMWFILFITVLFLLYYVGRKNYDYWKTRGIPGPKPTWFVGNVGDSLVGRKSMMEIYGDIYRNFEGHSSVGIYRIGTPCLLIRDLDFIKAMMIKDFKHFMDNDVVVDKEYDRILARNPFFLKGSEWRQKRQLLTSCFTSGKIKGMFPLLEDVSEKLVEYIEDNSGSPIEIGEACIKYTLNNVAACAFGLDGKCFKEQNSEFRVLANNFLSPGIWVSIITVLFIMFPGLTSILKVSFVPKEVEDKLIDIVGSTLRHRKKNNIKRNDFLEYVSEIAETSDLFKEDIDVVAQAATFFSDGSETSSRVMRFVLFEIANNQEIQEKLREEINEVSRKHGNRITYEGIQEMVYLDACFNESMRKHPIVGQLFKVCTETYTYTPTNTEYNKVPITVEAGTSIIIPIGAIQKDEKYFEKPEEFIPERFLDKENIIKLSFTPFGEGPRSCIGMRFGITQIKLGLAQLVKNFKMTVNNKTQLPLKFDKFYLMLEAIGGLWINFEKLNQ